MSTRPSNTPFGGLRADGKGISWSGSAEAGRSFLFDGARHFQNGLGRANSIIKSIGATVAHSDGTFYNLIIFDKSPLAGDSGSGLIMIRADGTYQFVGLIKGQYNSGGNAWGTATTWTDARDAMGGASVAQIIN